ncbi:DapH/DapD/GlmU-related protein [Pseudomonas entomophila]|uniref:DapH/DapD/GlmU-related protein n=2 Tax=Pseudomonas entomophila TaxID=312306 RepID=A0ABY9QRW5_9PSED|nr:DapH/DapD/GlmU-related protein [Pseudomonas entomophila]WMW06792.1 DapH/DapD/GlmU-related protein [Pseudomonas entomophila]CAK17502.1 putative transferase; LpxA family [Pseudomonas entomophila L48]
MKVPTVSKFIAHWHKLRLNLPMAWQVTHDSHHQVMALLGRLPPGYRRQGDCAVHETATVETGAVLKGPIIIGAGCFVAAGAYLRGGVYLGRQCIVGPSCEVKSSFMLDGSKLAHFNFVGDSLIGANVNVEAGAIIANYRNELDGAPIRIRHGDKVIETAVSKFGALIGDGCKIGANAVIAPGALLLPGTQVPRLGLIDQFAYD